MTNYNSIVDTEIDPESPVTSSIFIRLRDNAVALTEGATGAPKTAAAALASNSVTRAKFEQAIRDYRLLGAGWRGNFSATTFSSTNVSSVTSAGTRTIQVNYWFPLTGSNYALSAGFKQGNDVGYISPSTATASSVKIAWNGLNLSYPPTEVSISAFSGAST